MKNIGLLLVLFSIMACGEKETQAKKESAKEDVSTIDTTPYDSMSSEEKSKELQQISQNGDLEAVKALIKSGADVNYQDSEG